MGRRERWTILGDVLLALAAARRERGEEARVTNLTLQANLPYDRLRGYLDELEEAGLVTRERMPRLTERGRGFLREYIAWTRVLERFGLGEVPHVEAPKLASGAGRGERGGAYP